MVEDSAEYLSALRAAGFNLYRQRHTSGWGAFVMADDNPASGDNIAEKYLLDMAHTYDRRNRECRELGLRVLFTIFGNIYTNGTFETTLSTEQKRLVDYTVARWGATVDLWQLCNEKTPPSAWTYAAAAYVRQVDPYKHPVSESWGYHPVPAHSSIHMNTPHWYVNESEYASDTQVTTQAATWKQYGKPVLVTEHGNKGTDNWDPTSRTRLRLRSWTAFFSEISFFLFNWGYVTDFNQTGASDIYVGRDERLDLQALQRFAELVLRPDTVITNVTVSDTAALRAYGLSSTSGVVAAYVHRYNSHSAPGVGGKSITMNLPAAGTGYWLNPSTGQIVSTLAVAAGAQTLTVPTIQVDMAFFSVPAGLDVAPLARVAITNSQWDGDADNDGIADKGPGPAPFGATPLTLTFDASASVDWDGGGLSYTWDFGDGSAPTSGVAVTHTYASRRSCVASLTVTDDEGRTARHGFIVRATADPDKNGNNAPVIHVLPAITVREGEAASLKVRVMDREWIAVQGAHADGSTSNAIYTATNLPAGAAYEQIEHALTNQWYILKEFMWVPGFDQAGTYDVTFNVVDDAGLDAAPATVRITVIDAPSAAPVITGVVKPPGGSLTLTAVGMPGVAYTVLARTNLFLGGWEPVGAVTSAPSGVMTWTDPNATNYPSQFYRLCQP